MNTTPRRLTLKKKLLSVLFSIPLILTIQNYTSIAVKTQGYKSAPLTPQLKAQSFDVSTIESVDDVQSPDKEISEEDPLCFLSLCSFVAGKNNIQSIIGNQTIFVYMNSNVFPDKTWIIFRSLNGMYICYQPDDSSAQDDRNRVVSDVARRQNTLPTNIKDFLPYAKNVILDLRLPRKS